MILTVKCKGKKFKTQNSSFECAPSAKNQGAISTHYQKAISNRYYDSNHNE